MISFFSSPRWHKWGAWVLPLLLLVLATWRPLAIPDEGRYAEVARWMWVSGDWLTPRLDGIPFFHKPPLLYWLEATLMAALGATPWVVRWVVAAHAMLMIALMYDSTRYFAGAVVARRAVWILGSSMTFLIAGQYVNHDMMVATWMGVAIWCFARAFMHESGVHAGWARVGFVACGLGILSKGLIGLLLPGLVLMVWIAFTRQWRKIGSLPWFSGLLLLAVVALPWFVFTEREHPGMLAYMFGKHQFGRYTATTFNNARPWWFYGVAVTLLLFPWVFCALADGVQRLQGVWQRRAGQHTTFDSVSAPWVALCWIWVLAILGFFSIPNSKLVGYALPVIPPLAVLAALWWQRVVAVRSWASLSFGVVTAVSLAIAVAANLYAGQYSLKRSARGVAKALACYAAPTDVVAVVDDFPYDLMFYAQRQRPIEVIQDWERQRVEAGDNWRRELLDGAEFDATAARALQPLSRLAELQRNPRAWVLVPRWKEALDASPYAGFASVYQDDVWVLYRGLSDAALLGAAKSPETTEHKGLSGCKHQGDQ